MNDSISFTPYDFRSVMSHFVTGVTVITCCTSTQEPIGFTANSFSSVSLDPPMVLFSLSRQAQCFDQFLAADYFAVNILNAAQAALSDRFASLLPNAEKWVDVDYIPGKTGCPLLPDVIATLECRTEHQYAGGDHLIFVGQVLHLTSPEKADPLLYCNGQYRNLR